MMQHDTMQHVMEYNQSKIFKMTSYNVLREMDSHVLVNVAKIYFVIVPITLPHRKSITNNPSIMQESYRKHLLRQEVSDNVFSSHVPGRSISLK